MNCSMEQRRIPIIDNGHGIDTPGKRSPKWGDGAQLFEYEFNRDIVRRICRMCEREGIQYIELVPEVEDIPLSVRCRLANGINDRIPARYFLVSIHANAGGGTGWEIYTSPGKTEADDIATVFYEEAVRAWGDRWKMRTDYSDGDPDKESAFYILVHTKMPAVLTENFFMDTERDCRFLMSDEGREEIARVHFEAIKRIIYT